MIQRNTFDVADYGNKLPTPPENSGRADLHASIPLLATLRIHTVIYRAFRLELSPIIKKVFKLTQRELDADTGHSGLSHHMAGTARDLPASTEIFKVSQCFHISAAARCLVNRSAGFSAPKTFLTWSLFAFTAACSHKYPVSKCLSFPSPAR